MLVYNQRGKNTIVIRPAVRYKPSSGLTSIRRRAMYQSTITAEEKAALYISRVSCLCCQPWHLLPDDVWLGSAGDNLRSHACLSLPSITPQASVTKTAQPSPSPLYHTGVMIKMDRSRLINNSAGYEDCNHIRCIYNIWIVFVCFTVSFTDTTAKVRWETTRVIKSAASFRKRLI